MEIIVTMRDRDPFNSGEGKYSPCTGKPPSNCTPCTGKPPAPPSLCTSPRPGGSRAEAAQLLPPLS